MTGRQPDQGHGGPGTGTPFPGGRPPRIDRLDLRTLAVPHGGARTYEALVPVEPLTIAGQRYVADPPEPVFRLDAVRSLNGWHLRLRGTAAVGGPCWRCLEPARVPLTVDVTEVSVDGSDDPEMQSLYIDKGVLDVSAWARDAVAEALPPVILCREDCAGLCPTCGADRNAGPCGCATPEPDPRWGPLADLARRLAEDGGRPGSGGGAPG
jgi:uncharacterized protein